MKPQLEITDPFEPVANIEAEQHLLGSLLCRRDVLYLLPTDFSAAHFYEPLHAGIYQKIVDTPTTGEASDFFTIAMSYDKDGVLDNIGGARNYLTKLAKCSILVNDAPALARLIIDLAERRNIVAACEVAIARAKDISADIPAGEIAASISNAVENITSGGRYEISTERQVTERLLKMLQEQRTAERSETGICKLDSAMDGGMYAGKLYGIVGRKKIGKTMFAGTISHNLQKAGIKHLYLALEMGSDEIHQRSLAREVGCKESIFRLGDKNDYYLKKMAEYAVSASNSRMYLDAPCLNFDDLRHILPIHIRKHKLKGFILDCWQLVGGKPRGKSNAEHLDDVAQWLAETCKKYKVWGLVTAQENQDENTRGGEGLRLACDQIYRICKSSEESTDAWLEMMETRYTRWIDIGNEMNPSLSMNKNGTHYDYEQL